MLWLLLLSLFWVLVFTARAQGYCDFGISHFRSSRRARSSFRLDSQLIHNSKGIGLGSENREPQVVGIWKEYAYLSPCIPILFLPYIVGVAYFGVPGLFPLPLAGM